MSCTTERIGSRAYDERDSVDLPQAAIPSNTVRFPSIPPILVLSQLQNDRRVRGLRANRDTTPLLNYSTGAAARISLAARSQMWNRKCLRHARSAVRPLHAVVHFEGLLNIAPWK